MPETEHLAAKQAKNKTTLIRRIEVVSLWATGLLVTLAALLSALVIWQLGRAMFEPVAPGTMGRIDFHTGTGVSAFVLNVLLPLLVGLQITLSVARYRLRSWNAASQCVELAAVVGISAVALAVFELIDEMHGAEMILWRLQIWWTF